MTTLVTAPSPTHCREGKRLSPHSAAALAGPSGHGPDKHVAREMPSCHLDLSRGRRIFEATARVLGGFPLGVMTT